MNNVKEEGIPGATKFDGGKPPVYRGVINYFPAAIRAVAAVSAFGATKYAWNGYLHVPDGINRYSDAMVRHLLAEGEGSGMDDDSGFPHHWHTLWGALARTELMERENGGPQ